MVFQRPQRRSFSRSVCQLEREKRKEKRREEKRREEKRREEKRREEKRREKRREEETTICLRQRSYACGLGPGSVREHPKRVMLSHPYCLLTLYCSSVIQQVFYDVAILMALTVAILKYY
ncbi:hypothetical protein DUI87_16958 [Hirundo rustica rustica]|uniref:Uncharacterized protein n=1 Tax=Hirundo rustica rustica TaxID=333673 RepID=A0A3M0K2K9_HIRRU|nr:hypothetical protein DUI87_16958 [Hirundo rustica rustica]